MTLAFVGRIVGLMVLLMDAGIELVETWNNDEAGMRASNWKSFLQTTEYFVNVCEWC